MTCERGQRRGRPRSNRGRDRKGWVAKPVSDWVFPTPRKGKGDDGGDRPRLGTFAKAMSRIRAESGMQEQERTGVRALTMGGRVPGSVPSTSRLSAWFCVDALTRSRVANDVRKAVISRNAYRWC